MSLNGSGSLALRRAKNVQTCYECKRHNFLVAGPFAVPGVILGNREAVMRTEQPTPFLEGHSQPRSR